MDLVSYQNLVSSNETLLFIILEREKDRERGIEREGGREGGSHKVDGKNGSWLPCLELGRSRRVEDEGERQNIQPRSLELFCFSPK